MKDRLRWRWRQNAANKPSLLGAANKPSLLGAANKPSLLEAVNKPSLLEARLLRDSRATGADSGHLFTRRKRNKGKKIDYDGDGDKTPRQRSGSAANKPSLLGAAVKARRTLSPFQRGTQRVQSVLQRFPLDSLET